MVSDSAGTLSRALAWFVIDCSAELARHKLNLELGSVSPGRPHCRRLHASQGEARFPIASI